MGSSYRSIFQSTGPETRGWQTSRACCYHYKLSKSLYDLVRRETVEQRYINRHGKYQKYLKVLDASPELLIRNDTSRELESVNDLIGTQFANISEEYVKFMQSELRGREGYSQDAELDRVYEIFSRVREEAGEQLRMAQTLRTQNKSLRRPAPEG